MANKKREIGALEVRKRIGQEIKARRNKLKLSQDKLAELSGLYKDQISNIETAKKNTSIDTLNKVVEALGCKLPNRFLVGSKIKEEKAIEQPKETETKEGLLILLTKEEIDNMRKLNKNLEDHVLQLVLKDFNFRKKYQK